MCGPRADRAEVERTETNLDQANQKDLDMGTRAALIVGIDGYEHNPLAQCRSDAKKMFSRLSENEDGTTNFECMLVTSPRQKINCAMLLELVGNLLKSSADEVVFYFAGHGNVDERGGYLLTQDSGDGKVRVRMSELLAMANASKVPEIVILLDCCSANAMGEARGSTDQAVLREGLSILTAAREREAAQANQKGGLFTTVLCEALDGGSADVRGMVTVANTYAYMDESFGLFQQRPEFKAHVSRLVNLRRCKPAVPHEILKRLPAWFRSATDEHKLHPSYEPSSPPYSPEHEAIFRHLQKCRAAKLVEPVGFDHMYDAAMAEGACRLTPLGRHYRMMAKNGKF